MIGTELLRGQGLGNQLFCYVTTRCIAKRLGYAFSILGAETLANNIHSDCGLYFMEPDFGKPAQKADFSGFYEEKEERLFSGVSKHDLLHGAYVTGADEALFHIADGTLLMGNMQAEAYFLEYRDEIREWLRVKPEYDCTEYASDHLCILHLRCTDYTDSPELFLRKKYWLDGMENMRRLRSDMRFMIVTNDVSEAGRLLPDIPAVHFDLAKDYSIIKNASYLLLSNSSFAYFPALCSETLRFAIVPKYWARHNVSDGYWASEQNIYTGFHYQDRRGRLFTAEECRKELAAYKERTHMAERLNTPPTGARKLWYRAESTARYGLYRAERLCRGAMRRLHGGV